MLTSISTFFSRKTTKFLLARTLTSKPRHKEDRRRLPVMHKGQLGSRSPYIGRAAARTARLRSPRTLCIVSRCPALRYTFVSRRRRVLSRDLGAEMLLIMRPDKPALCRVLSITRTIFHERSAQRNRYMPPRLSTSLGDVWSPLYNSLTKFFSWITIQNLPRLALQSPQNGDASKLFVCLHRRVVVVVVVKCRCLEYSYY